ncbi:helix-turn-helix transcriptional regulator [Desulfococcaceae bacterium HSG7]|nr:helix-turn-helix transcriptional regulator [Desulfococcaceae bacterium HSG9]MDM8556458.1 helix-turn-helix transcriptional regulator [Desulfococcaceae bacterium HSG7]
MNRREFKYFRKQLGKTQNEIAQLLGISIKAIHSYEQGWRSIPGYIERQLFFLIIKKKGMKNIKPCWQIINCASDIRDICPAFEFKCDKLCWFISGTICRGVPYKNWKEKIKMCRTCKVFKQFL